ncbi:pyruvate kinase [Thermodesulfobacteriota bacterium]
MCKTKIICTIGPACRSPEILENMVAKGMSVARLNFSHGTHEEHEEIIRRVRKITEQSGEHVAILQDLSGPKIRVGLIPDPGIRLETGDIIILAANEDTASNDRIPVSYPKLHEEVKPGDRIMLADGFMELRVKEIKATEIICEVTTGGVLSSHKGINLPSGTIKAPSMTEKDHQDLIFGLKNNVDYVALSFVRQSEDILKIKNLINSQGKNTPVIAKIEKHEAIGNIDEILKVSDGIMVARGDLGVEVPLEDAPGIQKMLIKKANLLNKPVITATQMLRSMVESPRPTRAEATDVANAVLDGTDAVMLSEETAVGKYPVRAVQLMSRILNKAEEIYPHDRYLNMIPRKDVTESVSHASCVLADHLNASAIVTPTQSGKTAEQISHFRPGRPIIALSPNPETVRHLALLWGCMAQLVEDVKDTDDMIERAAISAINTGLVSKGDLVVITAGQPPWVVGSTNMLRVKRL